MFVRITLAAALALALWPVPSQSQCLPTTDEHPSLTWAWLHDLVTSADCSEYVSLSSGSWIGAGLVDDVLNGADPGGYWHIEIKTTPAQDLYLSIPGGSKKLVPDAEGYYHFTVDESVVAETGNWFVIWRNNTAEPNFEIDSSVAEYTGGSYTAHTDSPWHDVSEIPSDALSLEFQYEGPTATDPASWGDVKTSFEDAGD